MILSTQTESSEGGNVIPQDKIHNDEQQPAPSPQQQPRKFKNPTTIEEMKQMREQISKDKNLKRRVKEEYKKKVQIEAQGRVYSPPADLKQFKILQPRNLNVESLLTQEDDTSTKDISGEVFQGEK
jgi:Spy/CpxP family protein refolding chaperone